ncbi:MAG: AraC family transcriptional regulator [Rikenellaceae bacterium]
MENISSNTAKRTVVKYTTHTNVGLEPTQYSQYAIGYVLSGEKYIHDNEKLIRVSQGEVFFLGVGTHYIENIPVVNELYEQITFYYTPSQMQQIIASIDSDIHEVKLSPEMVSSNVAVERPNKILRNFFIGANNHFEYGGFIVNPDGERIKLMELALIILSEPKSQLNKMLLNSLDHDKAQFERVIHSNILNDKTIEELATECNKSLTSFKKEFKHIFQLPPHQWYLHQRLLYARLLLKTTRKSISQVGGNCAFPNTSHFIKLFKRQYGYTPANYRSKQLDESTQQHIAPPQRHHEAITMG